MIPAFLYDLAVATSPSNVRTRIPICNVDGTVRNAYFPASSDSPRMGSFDPPGGYRTRQWESKFHAIGSELDVMQSLATGWDGYEAEPPTRLAIEISRRFLEVLYSQALTPARIAASAAGGVGITFRDASSCFYVEVYNFGAVYAMSWRGADDPIIWPVRADEFGLSKLVGEIRDYINA